MKGASKFFLFVLIQIGAVCAASLSACETSAIAFRVENDAELVGMLCNAAETCSEKRVLECLDAVAPASWSSSAKAELCAHELTNFLAIKHCVSEVVGIARKDQAVAKLCTGTNTKKLATDRALCFRRSLTRASKLEEVEIALLCRASPTQCVATCLERLPETIHCALLCEGQESSSVGAEQCLFSALKESSGVLGSSNIAYLCQNAQSDAPARCIKKTDWKGLGVSILQDKIRFCRLLKDEKFLSDRAHCVKQSPSSWGVQYKVALCNGTSAAKDEGIGPAICARKMVRSANSRLLEPADVLALCKGDRGRAKDQITGEQRATCFQAFRSSRGVPTDAVTELCRSFFDSDFRSQQIACVNYLGSKFQSLDSKTYVQLCAEARNSAPQVCFEHAQKLQIPGMISNCASHPEATDCCIKALQESLPKAKFQSFRESFAHLCEFATKDMCKGRAECFSRLVQNKKKWSQDQLDLCVTAKDEYPAACAAMVEKHFSKYSEDLLLELCRPDKDQAFGIDASDPAGCFLKGKHLLSSTVFGNAPLKSLVNLCRRAPYGHEAVNCAWNHRALTSRRIDPKLLVDLCSSVQNGTASIEECVLHSPLRRNHEQLCLGSETTGPVNCARILLKKQPKLSDSDLVKFCQGATPDSNRHDCVHQFMQSKSKINVNNIAFLCASSPETAFECFEELTTSNQFKTSEIVQLCGANVERNCAISARRANFHGVKDFCIFNFAQGCLDDLLRLEMPEDAVIKICQTKPASARACVKDAARSGLRSAASIATLCSSESAFPFKCVRLAEELFLQEMEVALLCMNSPNEDPAKCFAMLEHPYGSISKGLRLKLCNENPRRAEECISDIGSDLHDFEMESIAEILCTGIESNVTAACFLQMPSSWAPLDRAELCSKANIEKDESPGDCAMELQHSFPGLTHRQIILICRDKNRVDALNCAKSLQHRVSSDVVVALCKSPSRKGDTTEKCFNYVLREQLLPGRSQIEACRAAISVPTRLKLMPSRAFYETITTGSIQGVEIGPIHFQLVDQFDFPIGLTTDGQVVELRLKRPEAEDELPPSNLEADQVNFVNREPIVFSSVRVIDVYGELELIARFQIMKGVRASVQRIYVNRDIDEHLRSFRSCGALAQHLQCLSTDGADVHAVPFPISAFLLSSACEKAQKAIGLEVIGFNIKNGISFVRLAPGPAKIFAKIGLPSSEMEAHEVLKVEMNSTATTIRRAYHKASLEWHPDRWVQYHPDLRAQASEIFQIFARAHAELQARTAAEQELCEN